MSALFGRLPEPLAYLSRGILILLLAVATTWVIDRSETMQYLRERNFEAWNREAAALRRPPPLQENPFGLIRVIEVSQVSYDEDFASTSPLSPSKIKRLAQVALDAGALVVAIDLDVSHWSAARFEGLPQGRRIVWALPESGNAQLPGCIAHASLSSAISSFTGRIAYHPQPEGIEGRALFPISEALADIFADPNNLDQPCPVPSAQTNGGSERKRIRFIARAPQRSFSGRLETTGPAVSRSDARDLLQPEKAREFVEGALARNQLVIIGATFSESGDKFLTPFGLPEFGVDVQADLLASLVSGGAVVDASDEGVLAVDAAVGAALLLLMLFFRRRASPGLIMSLPVLAAVLCLAFSLAGFLSLGHFISFTPIVLGIVVHEWLEFLVEHGHLRSEIAILKSENGRLRDMADAYRTPHCANDPFPLTPIAVEPCSHTDGEPDAQDGNAT
jgi:hypothetical protein